MELTSILLRTALMYVFVFLVIRIMGKREIGKLSVISREKMTSADSPPASAGASSKAKFRFEPLPVALIMDGEVQDDNLEKLGKTRFWLKNELRQRGIRSFKNVYFCSVDQHGKLYVNKKK